MFDSLTAQILLGAAILTALGVIVRMLHLDQALQRLMRLAALSDLQASFLQDWNGDAPRIGYEGRPSFPQRMTSNEQQTTAIGEQITAVQTQASAIEDRTRTIEERTKAMNHDMRDELGGRLALLQEQLDVMDERTKQLQRNGGSSVADAVHRAAAQLELLQTTIERVEAAATLNGESILDLSRRVTDVDERVQGQGERITTHRQRNDATVAALQEFIRREYRDLLDAREALRASVSELLMVEGHEERDRTSPPGQEP